MKDFGFLFSAPMIRGLRRETDCEGSGKTVTRRYAHAWLYFLNERGQRVSFSKDLYAKAITGRQDFKTFSPEPGKIAWSWTSDPIYDYGGRPLWIVFPKVNPGDRLWVRENLTRSGGCISYAATFEPTHEIWPASWKQDPRPSIHMPRKLSRFTLDVTSIGLDGIQAVTDDEARREGITRMPNGRDWWDGQDVTTASSTPRGAFYCLWLKLHGKASWEANPDVVAFGFKVHQRNIDSMKEAA